MSPNSLAGPRTSLQGHGQHGPRFTVTTSVWGRSAPMRDKLMASKDSLEAF